MKVMMIYQDGRTTRLERVGKVWRLTSDHGHVAEFICFSRATEAFWALKEGA